MASTTSNAAQLEVEGTTTGGGGLESTEIHEILSNERRVTVLELLGEHQQCEVAALAEAIAVDETGERPPPRNKRQSAYVTLDQTHLPKLDALGVVDYDSQQKVVSPRPETFDTVRANLDEPADEPADETAADEPAVWLDGAIAVGAAGLAATALSHLGLLPVAGASGEIFAEITLVSLFALLVYQKGRSDTQWFASVRNRLD